MHCIFDKNIECDCFNEATFPCEDCEIYQEVEEEEDVNNLRLDSELRGQFDEDEVWYSTEKE
jgi:hypothetical protein